MYIYIYIYNVITTMTMRQRTRRNGSLFGEAAEMWWEAYVHVRLCKVLSVSPMNVSGGSATL